MWYKNVFTATKIFLIFTENLECSDRQAWTRWVAGVRWSTRENVIPLNLTKETPIEVRILNWAKSVIWRHYNEGVTHSVEILQFCCHWYYVTSILADFRRSITAILTISKPLDFCFREIFTFENVKRISKSSNIKASIIAIMAVFNPLKSPKIDFT